MKNKLIGLFQLWGAVWGFVGISQSSFGNTWQYIIVIIFVLFFSFSAFAGLALIRKNVKIFSKINQYPQLFSFSLFGFSIKYNAGVDLTFENWINFRKSHRNKLGFIFRIYFCMGYRNK